MITFIFLGLKYGDKTTGAVTIQLVKGVCFTRGYLLKNHREVTLFFIEGIITFSIIQMWLSI